MTFTEQSLMKLVLGCDHGGLNVKQAVIKMLAARGDATEDFGTSSADSVDYPDFAIKVAEQIAEKRADAAILVCTTGIGMSIAANRFAGVRAALCGSVAAAVKARTHNDANVLVLAGTMDRSCRRYCADFPRRRRSRKEERHARRLTNLSAVNACPRISTCGG